MRSTLRWSFSVLVFTVLLVQLAAAFPSFGSGGAEKRSSSGACGYAHARRSRPAVVRRDLEFPDGKGKGDKPQNPSCKKWYGIRDVILEDVFHGACGDFARAAVRMAFHDAGTYSEELKSQNKPNGGADGSLLCHAEELGRRENTGVRHVAAALQPLAARFGVSNADILHVAGILGVIICPGGPIIETWIGRKDASNPNPAGMLPETHEDVPKMIARMADMGFTIRDTMALIGAHTTAKQVATFPSRPFAPLDSTPDIWDVAFYGETINANRSDMVILPSDAAFAVHPSTQYDFHRYVDNQRLWNFDYSKAHEKMSLLGQDTAGLIKCTEILPPPIELGPHFVDGDAGKHDEDDEDEAED